MRWLFPWFIFANLFSATFLVTEIFHVLLAVTAALLE